MNGVFGQDFRRRGSERGSPYGADQGVQEKPWDNAGRIAKGEPERK